MRHTVLPAVSLALVILAAAFFLNRSMGRIVDTVNRLRDDVRLTSESIDEPIQLENVPMQQEPCFTKVVSGTEVKWFCPPRESGETETQYAKRCWDLWVEFCDGLPDD